MAYEKGKPISGLVDGRCPTKNRDGLPLRHGLTEDGKIVTNGGRVLGVTATAPRLTNALSHAYEARQPEKIHFDGGLR